MGDVNSTLITGSSELQDLFRRAQEAKTPVYLYRRQPGNNGIQLDFKNWNQIEQLDVDNLMVTAPPGLLLKDLNAAANAHGLRFIPADTPLFANLSVGEWAYRGCPNPSLWKYGAGKHFLLGSTYVLPNGDLTPVGGRCIKNVSGYDFTRFFTGAYADLAVGVSYIIKLMPQPEYRCRYDAAFPSLADATLFVKRLQERSVPPAWLFWFDETVGGKFFGEGQQGQRLFFELDSNKAEVLDQAAAIDAILTACRGVKNSVAAELPDLSRLEDRADGFWLMDEFKVLYPSVPDFAERFSKQLAEHKVSGGLFGQLADGKIHVYLEAQPPAREEIIRALQKEAQTLGGASSGKYDRLFGQAGSGRLALLEKSVKKLIDPHLIFNCREEEVK